MRFIVRISTIKLYEYQKSCDFFTCSTKFFNLAFIFKKPFAGYIIFLKFINIDHFRFRYLSIQNFKKGFVNWKPIWPVVEKMSSHLFGSLYTIKSLSKIQKIAIYLPWYTTLSDSLVIKLIGKTSYVFVRIKNG